ncbi:hypothetical protein JCGZ_25597 [Jatropha curcas]|uniref:DSBA-like thioredoxin domain-containing protein n=1 Tax=Jatropha curcas TaxID=180498 RepID=A0A067JK05_JATCU|nr:hypothetical protein JCGZ_25597 [Jatropha curcas]
MRLATLNKFPPSIFFQKASRYPRIMSQSASNSSGKKQIRIDISSDTICMWCFVGKRNLDKAISTAKDRYNFEIRWHPFFLDPSAPKEGTKIMTLFGQRFGSRTDAVLNQLRETLRDVGLEFNICDLSGNTLDSHRLIHFAGQQGLDKQHNLAEELFLGYFTKAKYIGDREFLLECAEKVGVEGAAEFLQDPNNGVKEVYEDLHKYSAGLTGVPNYVINGKKKLNGAQPPEVFLRAFEAAAN